MKWIKVNEKEYVPLDQDALNNIIEFRVRKIYSERDPFKIKGYAPSSVIKHGEGITDGRPYWVFKTEKTAIKVLSRLMRFIVAENEKIFKLEAEEIKDCVEHY